MLIEPIGFSGTILKGIVISNLLLVDIVSVMILWLNFKYISNIDINNTIRILIELVIRFLLIIE